MEEHRDINDIDEAEVRRWANADPRVREVRLFAGFPCVHFSSARAFRQNLQGSGSNLFWVLLKLLTIINNVFSPTATFKWCIENVASMDAAARKEISRELQVQPIKLDPAESFRTVDLD